MKKLYVGNLAWSVTEDSLRELMESFGEPSSVKLITDRETGRSRGFAFVEMETADADAVMEQLNGTDLEGRPLRISEAQERQGGRR